MTLREKLEDEFLNLDFCETFTGIDYMQRRINEICEEFESRTCENCKHGTEEDGDVYECHISRDLFGWDNVVLPKDFGCNKFERKESD